MVDTNVLVDAADEALRHHEVCHERFDTGQRSNAPHGLEEAYRPSASSHLSQSMAARQPAPEAVIAWR